MSGFAFVYGDNINTDLIIAGKYTKTLDFQVLANHCMEDLDAEFSKTVKPGDFVVAGENFGCGSSREQAPLALKQNGVQAVLAKSFARIFYRNAINIGLPVLICDTEGIRNGDELSVHLEQGTVTVGAEKTISFQPFPPIMQKILSSGGLVSFLKQYGDYAL